jgi:hypothetical protein
MFAQSAAQVWAVVRDFGNYTVWVEAVEESHIEEGKPGDAVGAIRNVRMGDTRIQQLCKMARLAASPSEP